MIEDRSVVQTVQTILARCTAPGLCSQLVMVMESFSSSMVLEKFNTGEFISFHLYFYFICYMKSHDGIAGMKHGIS